jgi:hypothetical protein
VKYFYYFQNYLPIDIFGLCITGFISFNGWLRENKLGLDCFDLNILKILKKIEEDKNF